jgi:hypothetical protein
MSKVEIAPKSESEREKKALAKSKAHPKLKWRKRHLPNPKPTQK